MEKPIDCERCLSIFVLRTLRCSQDETRSILGCRKQTVVDAEEWIRACALDEAVIFCDDQAIKRLVRREFPTLEEISPELLDKAGEVTADDILRYYRQKDYLYRRRRHEEQEQFLALLQQWRAQVQFLSVDQLLGKFYFENWRIDLEREVTEPEEVSEAYFDAYGRHWGTIPKPYKAMLPVETDNSFQQLKKSHPDAELWQAQESWDKAYGIYWDAFASFVVELEYTTELLMGLAVEEGTSGDLGSKIVNARELIKKTKRAESDVWLFLRLLALAVACDLLILGIQEQSPQAFWALEVEKIRKLRSATVLASMNELPQHFWITGTNRVYAVAQSLWDSDQLVKEKTMALLKAMQRLQSAQNDVHNKLKALEQSLFGYPSIPTHGKT